MDFKPLPFLSPLVAYRRQAAELQLSEADLAQRYAFQDWQALTEYVTAVTQTESAVEAVIAGDVPALEALLQRYPDLVRARSTRRTNRNLPNHGATLLHYIAANGVEDYRQKTPPNAVEVAKALLHAGAEPDALADMYGEPNTTMNMLLSSFPPAAAGVQAQLAGTLLDFGASLEGNGGERSPLITALAFGYLNTAETLVRRGARVEILPAAAGLGRIEAARRLLPGAGAESRHEALALAAQHGHAEIVRLLLDCGEDPNRFNPKGFHGHSTPLHQAARRARREVGHQGYCAWRNTARVGHSRGAKGNRKLSPSTRHRRSR